MQILHLVEPPAPGPAGTLMRPAPYDAGALACRAAIERTPEFSHRVCLIGPTSAEHRAASLGLHSFDRISPAAGLPALAWFGLEALIRARGAPGAVQCWSRPLLRLARLALGNSVSCVGPPEEYPLPLTSRGVGRDQLRHDLGIGPDQKAVLLLADPPAVADARRFTFMLGLTEVAGQPCVGIIPAGARYLVRGRRFVRDAHLGTRLVFTDLPAWTLAGACDCAVLHAPGDEPAIRSAPEGAQAIVRAAGGAALLQGLPVVAPQGSGAETLFDEHSAPRCIATSAQPPDTAARLVQLLAAPDQLAKLAAHLKARTQNAARADRTVFALVARWLHPQLVRGGTSGVHARPKSARPGVVA